MILNSIGRAETRKNAIFEDKEAAEQYKCSICLNIMTDPTDIGCPNQHIYCGECITQLPRLLCSNHYLPHNYSCPQCRNLCSIFSTKKMPFIERQIKSLKVKCKNHQISAELISVLSRKNATRTRNQRATRSRSNTRQNSNDSNRERSRSRERY